MCLTRGKDNPAPSRVKPFPGFKLAECKYYDLSLKQVDMQSYHASKLSSDRLHLVERMLVMKDSRFRLWAGLEVLVRGVTHIERHQREMVAIRTVYMHGD